MDKNFLHELARLNNNFTSISNIGKLDIITEWIKLLSYEIEKDRKDVYSLYKMTGKELSIDELDILKKYKENKKNLSNLKKYQQHKCNEPEYIEVYNLIQKPITDEIINELSKNELAIAREKISNYSKMKDDDLNQVLANLKDNILELSIVDMYVLHIMMDINFTHQLGEFNRIK